MSAAYCLNASGSKNDNREKTKRIESKIEFYDTTLRDGAQAGGVSYSVADKKSIFNLLDAFGIDLIEGGDPASNPKDAEFFKENASPKLVAFGSTRRKDTAVYSDEKIIKLLDANTPVVCIFGKASGTQAEDVLGVTKEENLQMIADSVSYLKARGKRVVFDAEHFFDGCKEDSVYALSCLITAYSAGADTVVLCDTNGGTSPIDVYEMTKRAINAVEGAKIGIHTHNDTGTAVASSVMAVKAGATHVQGTFLGFGERCGNANLSTIIGNLALKEGADTGVDLAAMSKTARAIAEICNINLDASMPYVGAAAFAHKAGMHSDAVIKHPESFEHINPKLVGNKHEIVLSEMAGRSAVAKKLSHIFPELDKTNPKTREILDAIKLLEMKGYQFEGADGSLVLLAERMIGGFKPSFELVNYCIKATKPDGENAAEVSIKVGDKITFARESGNGPVNALDKALRKALSEHYPQIGEVSLTDYKVRVVDSQSATGAMVRVLITSSDKQSSWTTVGVSTDIIEASWSALTDSLEYKLTGQCRVIL